MSAIVEIKVPVERIEEIVRLVWDVEKRIDTVVALGVGTRCDDDGEDTIVAPVLERLGYKLRARQDEHRPRPRHESGGGASRSGDGKAMTNTLHRFGDAESFRDDYIVFAIASRGKNDEDSVPKLRRFLEIALAVQAGQSRRLAPRRRVSARRSRCSRCRTGTATTTPDFQEVIDGLDTTCTAPRCSTTSKPRSSAPRRCAKPTSASASTSRPRSTAPTRAATPRAFPRHSAGYSLGFEGKTEHLPNGDVLALSTMCGHGMVSMSLAKKMIDWVKEGRRTPEQAAVVSDAGSARAASSIPSRATPAAGRSAGADEVRRAAEGLVFALRHRAAACGGARHRRSSPHRLHQHPPPTCSS